MKIINVSLISVLICISTVFSQAPNNVKSKMFLSPSKRFEKVNSGAYYQFSRSTMCAGVQNGLPWDPIKESKIFNPVDSAAIAWVELANLYVPVRVKWVFIDPKGNNYYESKSDWTTNPTNSGYDHWSWWKLWSWIYINGYSPADLSNWGNWKVEIYVEENYSGVWNKEATLSFRIDGYNVQIEDPGEENIPTDYSLEQNYPNPFNSSTLVTFSVPVEGKVTLKLYNIIGDLVGTIVDDDLSAGTHQVEVSGENLPSGVYFYELRSGNFVDIKKLALVR